MSQMEAEKQAADESAREQEWRNQPCFSSHLSNTPDSTPSLNPPNTSIHTPSLHFRPRKFSSPFVQNFPLFNLDDITDSNDDAPFLLADSGVGPSMMNVSTDKRPWCPKYHIEGFCEFGSGCSLIHERKHCDHDKKESFNLAAPEFYPTHPFKWNNKSKIPNLWRSAKPDPSATTGLCSGTSGIWSGTSGIWSGAFDSWNGLSSFSSGTSSLSDYTSRAGTSGLKSGTSSSKLKEDQLAKELTTMALRGRIGGEESSAPLVMSPPVALEEDRLRRNRKEIAPAKPGKFLNPMKYKTEPCMTYYTIGACPYGDRCFFYHKLEEKHKAKSKVKTRLCKSWSATGWCHYGDRCDFAHGCEELNVKFKTRFCKVFHTTGRCPYGAQCTFAHSDAERRRDISTVYKFKTELCQLWLKGDCSFGAVCHFAHGVHELQTDNIQL